MRLLKAFAVLGFIATVWAAAPPASAQDLLQTENERIYYTYHKAIHTAARCYRIEFNEEEQARMARHINAAINHDIGAKRLRIIGQAKRDAEDSTSGGCSSTEVQESLGLFDSELRQYVPRLE
jgi:hypothetical protein